MGSKSFGGLWRGATPDDRPEEESDRTAGPDLPPTEGGAP